MRDGIRRASIALVFLAVAGCIQDPFGFASRPLVGRFTLENTESDVYFLHGPAESTDQRGGFVHGAVLRLAWDSTTILIERRQDNIDDYVAVDVPSGWVRGPLDAQHAAEEPLFEKLEPAAFVWRGL